MEPTIYSNKTTRCHSIWRISPALFNDISNRDRKGSDYFSRDIEALDMDTYEKTRGCYADRTVDAVIGIETCINKKCMSPRLMMIELRTNYDNPNNLSKSELEGKVSHSSQLLGAELPVERHKILLFRDEVAAEARSWVASKTEEGGEIRNMIVWSVKNFNDSIKSFDEMPYTPIYSEEFIITELDSYIKVYSWKKFFDKVHFWIDKAIQLRYKNTFEYDHICNTLLTYWTEYRNRTKGQLDDDLEIESLIIDEDIDVLR